MFQRGQRHFSDDAVCLRAVMLWKFGGTRLACPGCASESLFHPITRRKAYACQDCGYHVYPCAGTVFNRTRTPLTHWFFAMHLLAANGDRLRAADLERIIGCSYKTAARMTRKLRQITGSEKSLALLDSTRHSFLARLDATRDQARRASVDTGCNH